MLLDEIIDLATDDRQSITVVLRKCVVLAHHLANDRLKAWANDELNGYASPKELPEYRHVSVGATGTFVGPGWIQFQRGIPSGMLKQEHKEWAESVYICQSIKSLEHLLHSGRKDTTSFLWDENLVALYQHDLLEGYTLTSAHQAVPKSVFAGILDTVRTRVLNMALELKSEIGDTDEDLKRIEPQSQAARRVDQTITTHIYGGNVYIAAGQSSMTATTIQQQTISAGDWQSLEKVLRNAGLSDPDVSELSDAIRKDGKSLGNTVSGWVKKNAPKVLSGGVNIGATVGQALLLEYLKRYLGLT